LAQHISKIALCLAALYPIPMIYTQYGGAVPQQMGAPLQNTGVMTQRQVPVSASTMPELEPLKPQGTKVIRLPLTQKMVTLIGLGVLALFVALPISDSAILLNDFNYRFWSGDVLPTTVIIALVCVVLLYVVVSGSMGANGVESYTTHNVAMLVSTFCTLLGVFLVLTSMCMYYSEERITSAMMYNCKGSPETRDVTLYYNSLLSLRQTPACAKQFSIEQCAGYAAAAPARYADYMKSLETNFRCSGFCYTAPGAVAQIALSATPARALSSKPSFLSKDQSSFGSKEVNRMHRASTLPPALFSQGVYKTSCDGAAARNLNFNALSICKVWWSTAFMLIGLSFVAGFAEWAGGGKTR